MDLISHPDATKIVVVTDHVAKDGSPKIVETCTLPLTGARVTSMIITDLCLFDRLNGGLTPVELAPEVDIDEVWNKIGADFEVAQNMRSMEEV